MKCMNSTLKTLLLLSILAIVLYIMMIALGYFIEVFGAINGIRAVVLPLSVVILIMAYTRDKSSYTAYDLKALKLIKGINIGIFIVTIATVLLMMIIFSPLFSQ